MDWMPYAWIVAATIGSAGFLTGMLTPSGSDWEDVGAVQFLIGIALAVALGLIHLGAWLATGAAA